MAGSEGGLDAAERGVVVPAVGGGAEKSRWLRSDRDAHLVPFSGMGEWTASADHLFQRAARGHGRRSGADCAFRPHQAGRPGADRREADGDRRREAFCRQSDEYFVCAGAAESAGPGRGIFVGGGADPEPVQRPGGGSGDVIEGNRADRCEGAGQRRPDGVRRVIARCAKHDRRAGADDAPGDAAPDGQLAHRRSMAVAVDRDRRCGEEHVFDRPAADERISGIHVHAVGSGL